MPWGVSTNTLPYELIVQESIRSAQQCKDKSVGISRVGSSSDVAARVLLKELKLEPDKDVAILQVGSSTERAAAFRTGRIAAFPSPPGTIHLAQGMPHRSWSFAVASFFHFTQNSTMSSAILLAIAVLAIRSQL